MHKKSSRFTIPNIQNKLKALIIVFKRFGTPIRVVSQEKFCEIFKEPNIRKFKNYIIIRQLFIF